MTSRVAEVKAIPSRHQRSLAGSLRDKIGRHPDDESWEALRTASWETPDPDRRDRLARVATREP